jgi:poly-gamma-glutamate capsule biosynthesis protein CapA/YwtB (metallophosphatase superfamily)
MAGHAGADAGDDAVVTGAPDVGESSDILRREAIVG